MGLLIIRLAAAKNGIPKSTISDHLTATSSKVGAGRPTQLDLDEEVTLAKCIKTMDKWGVGLSRTDIVALVGEYVKVNNMKTTFKDGVPGWDWWKYFKQRHNLSLKKPETKENSRYKAENPFLIYGFFYVLSETLNELELLDKPHLVYNLDETSFCTDPSRTKVVGQKNSPSFRRTAGTGRENTTVLGCINAAGAILPP